MKKPRVDARDEHATLTLGSTLARGQQRLAAVSASAALDARVLMQHVTGYAHSDIIARGDSPLTDSRYSLFEELLAMRLAGVPVAYITGHREFWSMDFLVTPDTLIPRPETEILVEQALQRIPADENPTVADLGTGSGAVALAIGYERPLAKIIATDMSLLALAVARVNEERLGLGNVELRPGHWLSALGDDRCNLIVSNPPYVRESDPHLQQGDVRYEPIDALASGEDGLEAIREIVDKAPAHLKPGGWLLLEHGFDQAAEVRRLMSTAGLMQVATVGDLSQQERVTLGRQSPN